MKQTRYSVTTYCGKCQLFIYYENLVPSASDRTSRLRCPYCNRQVRMPRRAGSKYERTLSL